ncbi:MAG: ATP-binding cassette domain-containing protein [Nevskiales bacterium]
MPAALEIQALTKRYGELVALQDVSLRIEQGEYFGLLGPNGAGKSTLINIVASLVRASSGQVAILGHDLQREFRAARKALGVVPQELVFDPFFPVRELLRIQAGYYGCGREVWGWIDELLQQLDLWDKRKATMRQLSGGMKRRVLIAQAMVHKPQLVILDEPTAGVDVELRRALWRFTRQLHADGHTIVLTTHYLEEAEALCERIGILNKGRLRALETKQDLLSRHPWRFLKLKLDGPLPASLRDRLESEAGGEVELKLHRERDRIAEVLDALRAAGRRVDDIRSRDPSLEDVFVELTQEAGQ